MNALRTIHDHSDFILALHRDESTGKWSFLLEMYEIVTHWLWHKKGIIQICKETKLSDLEILTADPKKCDWKCSYSMKDRSNAFSVEHPSLSKLKPPRMYLLWRSKSKRIISSWVKSVSYSSQLTHSARGLNSKLFITLISLLCIQ